MDGYLSRLLMASALLLAAAPAPAVEFVVDTTADAVDATLDGTCADADGRCTLRAAVQEANDTLDADTIQLPAGVYKLTETGALEDSAASGDLDVTAPLTIHGVGAATTVVQGKKDRVIDVFATDFTATDLTVTKGKAPKSEDDDEASGGGVRNRGNLQLTRVVLTRNSAPDDSGAITNIAGQIGLIDVTLSRNKAADDAGAMDNDGGAIVLTNVTFYKNKAKDEAGAFESEEGGTVNESCVSCHGEKRGPHLWEHPPVTESCSTCHDPHGSNNDRMLVAKQPFLCQRCHVTSRHPPTVYEGTLLNTSQNANKIYGRSCVICHQQVHGSNGPNGKALLR